MAPVPVPSNHPLFLFCNGFTTNNVPLYTFYKETGPYMIGLHTQVKKDLKFKIGETIFTTVSSDMVFGKSYQ